MQRLGRWLWHDDGDRPRVAAWLALAAAIRGVLIWITFAQIRAASPGTIVPPLVEKRPDWGYFFTPVEHLIRDGMFWYREGIPFAGRMPGYPGPYYLLRQLLDPDAALNALIAAQMLLAVVATYALARAAQVALASRRAFVIAFALAACNLFGITADFRTEAESFTFSAFAIHLLFLARYLRGARRRDLVWSGLWLAWAIFLRPSTGLALAVEAPVVLVVAARRAGWRSALAAGLAFCAPFAAADAVWIVRNYAALGRFIPLQTGVTESYGVIYSPQWLAVRHWIVAWGGDRGYFREGSVSEWMRRADLADDAIELPREALGDAGYTAADVRALRRDYQRFRTENLDPAEREALGEAVLERAAALREAYVRAHPFRHYVVVPLQLARPMIVHSGSPYVHVAPGSWLRWPLRIAGGVWYYGLLLGFAVGSVRLWRRHGARPLVVVAWTYSVLLVPAVIVTAGTEQARYVQTAHALWIVIAPAALAAGRPDADAGQDGA